MRKLYDTDVSDAAWAIVEPHLPPAKPVRLAERGENPR